MFRIFFHYIYSGRLYSKLIDREISTSRFDISQLYFFEDMRRTLESCNACIDLWFQKHAMHSSSLFPLVPSIYENTPDDLWPRRCNMDIFISSATKNLRDHNLEANVPPELLADVVETLAGGEIEMSFAYKTRVDKFVYLRRDLICPKYHDHGFVTADKIVIPVATNEHS